MNRRTGFGLSMLLASLWVGQTALGEPAVVAAAVGVVAVALAAFAGGILTGVIEPERIPDEEMSRLATGAFLTLLVVGGVALALLAVVRFG
ncbi:hypothetical protein RYH80_00320 [Halobaculum sp. MBLA0147]|uniref:hypothetical protein n=1 Tax=Halobaculum sp. MBLA0147 TaxID=3079934 RepID=UPI0035243CBD